MKSYADTEQMTNREQRRRRRWPVALAGGALAVALLGACGSSKSTKATNSTGTGASAAPVAQSTSQACASAVKVDAVSSQGPGGSGDGPPPPDQIKQFAQALSQPFDEFAAAAPASIKDPVEKMQASLKKAEQTGEADAIDPSNPEVASTINSIEKWVHDSCGFQKLQVMGVDYAFQDLPPTLKAGNTSVVFMNHSASGEEHEMTLLKVKPGSGVTAQQVADALKTDAQQAQQTYGDKVDPMGDAQAAPGATGYTTVNLTPGDYVAACFVGDPPHTQKGMVSTFTVS